MRNVKDLVKRGLEGCRAWKKGWKNLLLLGIVLLVAAGLFFAIPNPYRDAWDDLFLPYPEEFPKPGVYVNEDGEYSSKVIYMHRNSIIPPIKMLDRDFWVGRRKIGSVYKYQDAWMIADIKVLNYVDVLYEYTNKEGEVYLQNIGCMIVGKIEEIFSQRESMDDHNKEAQEGDVVTVLLSQASSKEAIYPYPEIGINQNWLFALKQAHHSSFSDRFVPAEFTYCMTDYVAEGISHILSIPMRKEKSGNTYADMSDVKTFLEQKEKEKLNGNGIWNIVPKTLVDEQWRITDIEALCDYFDDMLEKYPYRVSLIMSEAKPVKEVNR